MRQLQRVYEGVLDFAQRPEQYMRTSFRFVDFGIRKEARSTIWIGLDKEPD